MAIVVIIIIVIIIIVIITITITIAITITIIHVAMIAPLPPPSRPEEEPHERAGRADPVGPVGASLHGGQQRPARLGPIRRGGGGGDGGRRRRAGIGREVRSGHSWGDAEGAQRAERRSQGGGRGTEADRSKDQVAAQRRAGGSAVRENEVGVGQLWRRTGDPNLLRLGSTTLADRDAHRNAYEVGACSHAVMHHREGREGNKRRGEAEAEAQTQTQTQTQTQRKRQRQRQRQRLSLSVRWHFTPYGLNFCPGWGFSLPLPFLAMYSS